MCSPEKKEKQRQKIEQAPSTLLQERRIAGKLDLSFERRHPNVTDTLAGRKPTVVDCPTHVHMYEGLNVELEKGTCRVDTDSLRIFCNNYSLDSYHEYLLYVPMHGILT